MSKNKIKVPKQLKTAKKIVIEEVQTVQIEKKGDAVSSFITAAKQVIDKRKLEEHQDNIERMRKILDTLYHRENKKTYTFLYKGRYLTIKLYRDVNISMRNYFVARAKVIYGEGTKETDEKGQLPNRWGNKPQKSKKNINKW